MWKKSRGSKATGFITPCAESFWGSGSGQYWDYTGSLAKGSCVGSSIYSDVPDGDVVEKGGAGQRLRGVGSSTNPLLWTTSTNYSTRTLKTCDGSSTTSCTTLTDFNTTNISPASVGLSDNAERDALVAWVRGQDLDNENGNLTPDSTQLINEMRPSAHGDVVHAQPGVVDFGNAGVVAFYGSNDGMFHAVNGSKTDSTGGNELWSFVAPETLTRFKRLRDNSPRINLPGVSLLLSPTPIPKDYFFDGSVGVYQNSGTVWIFPTMRRGGRAAFTCRGCLP